MDAVLLTWRWQNILSIWIMAIALFLLVTVARQIMMRAEGEKAAHNG
jgi:hypothetical protein